MTGKEMLRRQIPSDIEHLNELYKTYKFIPNELTCRPHPDIRAIKEQTLLEIQLKWTSMEDFILFRIFGKQRIRINGKFAAKDRNLPKDLRLFRPNEFPYNIEEGNHWILWYGTKEAPCDEQTVTKDIDLMLHSMFYGTTIPFEAAPRIGYYEENDTPADVNLSLQQQQQMKEPLEEDFFDTYDFAWYPNPKVSVPEFYHVHVFWKHLRLKKNLIYSEAAPEETLSQQCS